jgi:tetratricopeptide (TPR) repeat protein
MARPQAALTLGNWYYDHEQWGRAVQEYRRAIAGGINNPNIRTDLGNSLRFSNQPKKALEQYQLAQKMDPTHEQSLFNQGALYASSLGDRQKGIQMWQTYLQRFPNGATADAARSFIAQAQSAG